MPEPEPLDQDLVRLTAAAPEGILSSYNWAMSTLTEYAGEVSETAETLGKATHERLLAAREAERAAGRK